MKNALKSLGFLMVLGATISISSCGSDDDGGGNDIMDDSLPVITVNSPQDGALVAAGSQVATSISISDDIEISSVSITVGNSAVTIFELDETDVASDSYSFSNNLSIPANVVLGEHTVEVTVTDASNNTATASLTIEALPAYTDGQTTVMVAGVPDQVDDYTGDSTIYMVGAHQGWSHNGSHPLSLHTDSEGAETFFIQVGNDGIEGFKFVRGTSREWENGEKGAEGEEIDNRTLAAGETHIMLPAIATWKDFNPDVRDNSSTQVIDGTGVTEIAIKGEVVPAFRTPEATVSSATWTLFDSEGTSLSTGSVTVSTEDGTYDETLSITDLPLGTYEVQVLATDVNGSIGRGDGTFSIVEFPCDETGLPAVDPSMTRVLVNVSTSLGSRDLIVTGKINGNDVWGTVSEAYTMTKISDGCYYIDLVLAADDALQFFYDEPSFGADWWKGAATQVAGDGGTAQLNVTSASDGNSLKAVYGFWREEPPAAQ